MNEELLRSSFLNIKKKNTKTYERYSVMFFFFFPFERMMINLYVMSEIDKYISSCK